VVLAVEEAETEGLRQAAVVAETGALHQAEEGAGVEVVETGSHTNQGINLDKQAGVEPQAGAEAEGGQPGYSMNY